MRGIPVTYAMASEDRPVTTAIRLEGSAAAYKNMDLAAAKTESRRNVKLAICGENGRLVSEGLRQGVVTTRR